MSRWNAEDRVRLENQLSWLDEAGRNFERLVGAAASDLVEELGKLDDDDLRAIVLQRVLARRYELSGEGR